jgi:hypothetical protein
LNDPRSMHNSIATIRLTSKAMYETVGKYFEVEIKKTGKIKTGNEKFVWLTKKIRQSGEELRKMPFQPMTIVDRDSFDVRRIALNAEFIPLRTFDECREDVDSIFKLKDGPAKTAIVHSLALNIDYLTLPEQSKIGGYVFDRQKTVGGLEVLVESLIERAEHLEYAGRVNLVQLACGIEDTEKRLNCLNAWSGKMVILRAPEQRDILSIICKEGDGKGHLLGLFASQLDKILPENREIVARSVIELPVNHLGRMLALSQLAANLNHLDENTEFSGGFLRGKVVSEILDAVSHQQTREPSSEEPSLWYTEELLCKIEALHHLSSHKNLLEDRFEEVNSSIEKILEKRQLENLPAQTQLLPHMSQNQREDFVRTALADSTSVESARGRSLEDRILFGLALRTPDLSTDELIEYVDHVEQAPTSSDFIEESLKYNFKKNLELFGTYQRSALLEERLDFIRRHASQAASSAFSDIAINAKYLTSSNILSVIKSAKDKFSEYRYDDYDPIINPFTHHCARALANWSRESLLTMPRSGRLDERQRERSVSR